jgi:signal transduction histidine kinase
MDTIINADPNADLLAQWRAFLSGGSCESQQLRPVTLQSWARCRDIGIDPHQLRFRILSDEELAEKRSANARLLGAARPYMQHLSLALSDRVHCIALSDADGWIVELLEQPKDALGGAATGICVGSSWNERDIGNNGIGTALALGQPVFVHGIEHFAAQFHSAHCLGVPIRIGNRVVGCLDVSVARPEDANPAHMTLARACVASIESTLDSLSRLETRTERLERFATIGSLLATTLHDLRNPLNVMKGISQIGLTTAKGSNERTFFEKLNKHAAAMEEMIQRLQEFARKQEPVRGLPLAMVLEVLEDVASICAAQGIVVHVSDAPHAECLLHPALFRRAIHNIVSNALKAMPQGGVLRVRADAAPSRLVLAIEDTGPGIPAEIRESAFEPFVTSRADGTGLGLYMVHQAITKDHGGRVWFESPEQGGTTFFVELPTACGG